MNLRSARCVALAGTLVFGLVQFSLAPFAEAVEYRKVNAKKDQAASGARGGEEFEDVNVNLLLLSPETHPELWAWQDGYHRYFPQWNSMKYYKAVRTES